MKILMIAYYFYPDITPRSFRAFELAKEFSRQGHSVTIILPQSEEDYTELCKTYKFKIDFVNYKKFATKSKSGNTNHKKSSNFKLAIHTLLKKTTSCIFPSGLPMKFYFYFVYKKLMEIHDDFDMIISIAFPFDNHIGTALALQKNKKLKKAVKIAEYGDPLYKNPALPNCPLYYWIDKFIAKNFDYITTPTEKALPVFQTFKEKKFIKVIPQGFDFSNIKIAKYKKNKIPTFGYAGIFYKDIRNPKSLLEYLVKLHINKINFKFIIYTKIDYAENLNLLKNYKKILGNKLEIKPVIPREDVVYQLSKMDFLINIENLSMSQSPSKLIDYALTKRPVYSFNQDNFSEKIFNDFMYHIYDKSVIKEVDIDKYDIKNICQKFINIHNEGA